MAMLAVASEILLVVTPEVGAIRNSSQFLELARELGLASGIRVVVNRANHGIRMADMESALGLPISATVVSNGPKSVIASNEGKPIVTKFPKEKISDDLHRVARLVTDPGNLASASAAAPPSRRWWSRIVTRPTQAGFLRVSLPRVRRGATAPRLTVPLVECAERGAALRPPGAFAMMRAPCRPMTTSAVPASASSRSSIR
jgi:hypothetical protein